MADDAIDYLNRLNQISSSKPFFVKYAPGATHAPRVISTSADWRSNSQFGRS